jgi:hypothetical protein
MPYQKWVLPGRTSRGHSLSIERADETTSYVATLWEDGIPIARKPIADDKAQAAIAGIVPHTYA